MIVTVGLLVWILTHLPTHDVLNQQSDIRVVPLATVISIYFTFLTPILS